MQDYIFQRVIDIANYILDTGYTVRQTAQIFGVSKSTVHKDVTERLPQINGNLARMFVSWKIRRSVIYGR